MRGNYLLTSTTGQQKHGEMKTNKCKTCKHFKAGQRELNYREHSGFCTNDAFKFNIEKGRLIGVYDRENKKDIIKVSGNPSHDIETISMINNLNPSRYSLQVEDEFGCIYHENTNK